MTGSFQSSGLHIFIIDVSLGCICYSHHTMPVQLSSTVEWLSESQRPMKYSAYYLPSVSQKGVLSCEAVPLPWASEILQDLLHRVDRESLLPELPQWLRCWLGFTVLDASPCHWQLKILSSHFGHKLKCYFIVWQIALNEVGLRRCFWLLPQYL